MARSVWKGPFFDGYLLKKVEKTRESGRNEVIKIWSRRSTVLPQFVGVTFGVYNGHKHIPVLVSEDMIGHKFGEFSPTRTFYRPRGRPQGEEGLSDGQGQARARAEGQRGAGGAAHGAHQPAQAQSRRRS